MIDDPYDCTAGRHRVTFGATCDGCGRRGVRDALAAPVEPLTPSPRSPRRRAEPEPAQDNPFDCVTGRHKVITADAICVLCGARGVVDARLLNAS